MEEKKIKGRKRHIVTDTQGDLLYVKVHAANIHDTKAGVDVMKSVLKKYPSIRGVSADAGYRGTTKLFLDSIGKICTISQKIASEWTILTKRWIVERTLSWLSGSRRLSKDYEISIRSAENFIRISHIYTLIKRLGIS